MREFNDIASFIAHMALAQHDFDRHLEQSLDGAAQLIEDAAKAELGHYQPAVGPFSEWPQLAPATLQQHAAVGVGDTPLLVHGALYSSIERETHGMEAVIGTKSEIGEAQEFGTEKIPPRPFMGPAAVHAKDGIERIMARGLVNAIVGEVLLPGESSSEVVSGAGTFECRAVAAEMEKI